MAIGKEIRGPPAMRRAADAALAETAGVDAKAGRQRTKQLDGLAVRFLSHLVAPADRDRMAEYVHATLSRGRRGASALSFGTLSGTVPAGFTDQHVRLLVRYRPRRAKYVTAPRQTVLYLSMLHGQSAVEIRLTSRYGGAIQATVVARRAIAPDVLLGDLLGAAVDVSVQDEDLVRQSGREGWDFSILASLKKRGRAQLFLGPARFVNHDCQPNVKLERVSTTQVGFRSLRAIGAGEEVLTSYGRGYFGDGNAQCLCTTCTCAPLIGCTNTPGRP